ncbi:carbohydrate ABC transporter permease [Paenibacillus sp. PAMC21692]|uniref:carbohydrate ABC transporter permease n=1 Tax=Paenibacillus sp. PAMC21692 TaxID=2762320 RepID=UPI00164D6632|nr:carbohydrate ABC transporter permease [Paenibacillus sp. PAMC21692]QNK57251.1 carbohydrate ABC transporter permease [Paenibacillus sp. PAMC21692]
MYYKNNSYRIFYWFNAVLLSVIAVVCVLPLVHILAVSFSSSAAANANIVTIWPIDFTTDAYLKTLANSNFAKSILITVQRTLLGTVIGMAITVASAYSLSKPEKEFKGRTVYVWLFVFTMLFSGGLIPGYILIQKLHLMNSIWALLLPGLVNVWNMILMLNFYRALPKELEEAAFMDGAGYMRVMWSVYLPISLPAIATLSLFTMVGHWNAWFDGLIYMTQSEKWPLATLLQSIIVGADFTRISLNPADLVNISERTVKAAQIFISLIPIVVVYPFVQRYFVKGVVIGAIKE